MFPLIHEFDFFGILSEPLGLHTYGLLIATGFLAAVHVARGAAGQEGEDPERVVDLCFYILVAGLIGSRIVFIITQWERYASDPLKIFMFWEGGLVFYGGFIAATGFVFYYTRKHRMNFLRLADILVPSLALGHAFGRLGCLAAGCCFGTPTDVSWGVIFPDGAPAHQAHVAQGLISFSETALAIHPTQLYESGFEIIMFITLSAMRPFKRMHGQLFLIWLAIYPIFRSFNETLRGDKVRGEGLGFLGLSTSQYISIGVVCFAVWLFFYLRKNRPDIEPA